MQRHDQRNGRFSRVSGLGVRTAAGPEGSAEPAGAVSGPRYDFYWSQRALRLAAWSLVVVTLAMLPWMFADGVAARVAALFTLGLILRAALGIAERANCSAPVLSIDMLGITDRRLGGQRLHWQEIATFVRADLTRAKAIEFFLKRPDGIGASARGGLRFGAWLQLRMGMPAAAINLMLIDARAEDVTRAVAAFRPGLLPLGMRHPEV